MTKKTTLQLLILAIGLTITSCSKKDPPLPANTLNFQSAALGFEDNETSKTITVTLNRAADADVAVSIQVTDSLVTYGNQYTTQPAASNGSISLTIPAGSSSASFTVQKADGVFLSGKEKIKFQITSVSTPAMTGGVGELSLSFASIVSDGQQMTLEGGGATYPNTVFVSFRTNTQTSVQRDTWDLALSNGDGNNVLVNSTMGMAAYQINKTDIDAVGQADFDAEDVGKKALVGIGATEALDAGNYPKKYIDNPYNPIQRGEAIAPVATNNDDNKVYIVFVGPPIGSPAWPAPAPTWLKVRITSTSGGYQVDYAGLTETTHKTIQVSKTQGNLFSYVSFNTNNVVTVEPSGNNWAIAWTYGLDLTGYTSDVSGIQDSIPYLFQDLVYSNIYAGVKTASVSTDKVTYENFTEANLSGLSFNGDNRLFIGPNWRATTGSTTGINRSLFYIVQDAYGNVYKLRFVKMGVNDDGTRGKPEIEYALVKKG